MILNLIVITSRITIKKIERLTLKLFQSNDIADFIKLSKYQSIPKCRQIQFKL